MEWNKKELEERFAKDLKGHKASVRLSRSAILFGCIAVVSCGSVGVMAALDGRVGVAFTDIFLSLLNVVLVRQNIKRHRKEVQAWKQYETAHADLMERWDLEDCANEQKT